jgi:hypothetical protein
MTITRLRTLTTRARRTLSDMDYAQRRLFEIQTGIPITGTPRRFGRLPDNRPYRRDY